ncbi:MAG TPA: Ig-like domain-containing protein, partial [candidate division Zixibacteria bacterium]|nr:Ig-like domain-containing protein [candidate division Zixibacteria bacterium]
TDENTPVAGDVLADNGNGIDSDPDSDPITVSAVEGSGANVGAATILASGATVNVAAGGTFTYNPGTAFDSLADGVADTDSFTYTITDGFGEFDSATVTINLTGVNDGPDARNDAFGILEDAAIFSDSVFANNGFGADLDPDNGDTFTVTAVNGATSDVGNQITLASGALLTLNSDGTFDYDINGAFEFLSDGDPDTDSFTYTISDALGLMDTATVTINITGENDNPVANDDSFSIVVTGNFSGNVLTGVGSAADSDIDQNDTLSVTDINGNTGALGTAFVLPSGATVNMLSTGGFTYDSSGAGFSAPTTDSFTYGIADGNGGTDTATVNITVQPPGNTPPVAGPITDQFLENDVNRQTDLLDPAQVSDADLDNLDVANPVVTTEDGRPLLFTINPATGLFSINDGQFEDLADSETFDITVNYDVTDGVASVANTATVTIMGENDAPVIDDLGSDVDAAVQEDASSPNLADTGNVLFSDVDLTDSHTAGAVFTGTDFSGGQLGGMNAAVSAQTSGTTGLGGMVGWTFTVSNAAVQFLGSGETVTETYGVSVDDGLASDTVTVTAVIIGVNDDPLIDDVGSDVDGAVQEDSASPSLTDTGDILFSDADLIDGHTASALFAGTDFAGGQLGGMTAVVTTHTSAVDGQGGVLAWTFTLSNAAAQFLGSGQTVTETYAVSADDGLATDSSTVSIVISGINDDPLIDVAGSDGSGAVTEDAANPTLTDTGAILFGDADLIDGHTVSTSFTGTTNAGGQLGSLSAVVTTQTSAVDGQGGVADWTFSIANAAVQFLGAGESITETYDVIVNDGIADDIFSVSVVINGQNDAPLFMSDNDLTIDENQTFVDTVVAQDDDTNDVLSYSIDALVGDGSFFTIDANTGDLSFISAPDFETPLDAGADNFYNVRVEAFDGATTSTQDIMVRVLDVADNALTILGTPGFDQLSGTGANENFQSLGGIIDFNTGGGGSDTFSF